MQFVGNGSYEYDAFGNITYNSGGTMADDNPFRFSTKHFDDETGLSYYGYRYYDAGMGRWLNRDPIAEQGGLNLYGFVGNDGVNDGDSLGLASFWVDNLDELITRVQAIIPEVFSWTVNKIYYRVNVECPEGGARHLVYDENRAETKSIEASLLGASMYEGKKHGAADSGFRVEWIASKIRISLERYDCCCNAFGSDVKQWVKSPETEKISDVDIKLLGGYSNNEEGSARAEVYVGRRK
ncbi:hypothetical protein BVX97_05800, partial [bacterium E08(2017)]